MLKYRLPKTFCKTWHDLNFEMQLHWKEATYVHSFEMQIISLCDYKVKTYKPFWSLSLIITVFVCGLALIRCISPGSWRWHAVSINNTQKVSSLNVFSKLMPPQLPQGHHRSPFVLYSLSQAWVDDITRCGKITLMCVLTETEWPLLMHDWIGMRFMSLTCQHQRLLPLSSVITVPSKLTVHQVAVLHLMWTKEGFCNGLSYMVAVVICIWVCKLGKWQAESKQRWHRRFTLRKANYVC